MPSLVVPEKGFALESSPGSSSKAGSVVPDVFGLTLTDGMIEEMIKCVQNGKPIQLSLGDHPSFSYGTKVQHLSSAQDPFSYDLYQNTNTTDNDSDDEMAPPSHFIPKKNPRLVANMGPRNLLFPSKLPVAKPTIRTAPQSKIAGGAEGDPALAQLTSATADIEKKKQANTVKFIKDGSLGMPGKKGSSAKPSSNKNKFLSQNRLASDTTRSMPSSPSLNASGSPSLGPTSMSTSTQQLEQAKAARKPFIHLLAVGPITEKSLRDKLPDITDKEFKQVLGKVGDEVSGKYELNKRYYRELDVWSFDYESGDRQRAIDNAIKQYDKARLGVSEPEWDRLLVKSERGTGKCLSKLQVSIAQNTARAPKIKIQKADGSETPNGEDDDHIGDKAVSKLKGESSSRSASQPPTTKTKKVSEKEAQAKRLLSKNPIKSTPKPASKPAATKKQAPPPKAGSKVLSSEFVEDSDEDLSPPAPAPKPKAKPPTKRPREEEVETSDSSIPLSKKVKKDTPVTNNRISDASQASRSTQSSTSSYNSSYKNKNTSPHKSSPLASSPPTNASEFGSSGDRTSSSASPVPHLSTKTSRSPIHKRHQKSSSVTSSTSSSGSSRLKPDIADLARKFKMYYPKYEVLYKEITAMGASGKRDYSKEKDLLEMHARLEDMKKSIQAGIINDSDSQ